MQSEKKLVSWGLIGSCLVCVWAGQQKQKEFYLFNWNNRISPNFPRRGPHHPLRDSKQ